MDSKNLLYLNGHFYDKETKVRLALKDGGEFRIIADSSNFIPVTSAGNNDLEILDNKKKEQKIVSERGLVKHRKNIQPGGFPLFFNIPKA